MMKVDTLQDSLGSWGAATGDAESFHCCVGMGNHWMLIRGRQ
jgi:hypothetical protein